MAGVTRCAAFEAHLRARGGILFGFSTDWLVLAGWIAADSSGAFLVCNHAKDPQAKKSLCTHWHLIPQLHETRAVLLDRN